MTYFVTGAFFGAAFVIAAMVVTVSLLGRPKLLPKEKDPAPSEQSREDKYAVSIAMQWQNMAAYDGTDSGQRDIDR